MGGAEGRNATWVGLGALIVIFVALAVIFVRISKLEALRMKAADERVKLLNEVLQGIKMIKLMAWEDPVEESVRTTRSKELRSVRNLAYTKSMMIGFIMGSSLITSLVTFATYSNLYPGRLDPSDIFTAVALLNLLRFPLMQIPQAISAWAQCKISLNRIQELLEAEEVLDENVQPMEHLPPGHPVIHMKDCCFSWDAAPPDPAAADPAAAKRAGATDVGTWGGGEAAAPAEGGGGAPWRRHSSCWTSH